MADIATSTQSEPINHSQQLNLAPPSGISSLAQGVYWPNTTQLSTIRSNRLYTSDFFGKPRRCMLGAEGVFGGLMFSIRLYHSGIPTLILRDPVLILLWMPTASFGTQASSTWVSPPSSYTQAGKVTLLGLITEHKILIMRFANEFQHTGQSND